MCTRPGSQCLSLVKSTEPHNPTGMALGERRPPCGPAVSPRRPVPRCLTALASGPIQDSTHPPVCFRCGLDQVPQKPSAGLVWPLVVLHGGPSQSPEQQHGVCVQNLRPGFVLMNAVGCGEVTDTSTPASEGTSGRLHPQEKQVYCTHGSTWGSPAQARGQTGEPGECGPEPQVGPSQEGESGAARGWAVWAHSAARPAGRGPSLSSTWLGVRG